MSTRPTFTHQGQARQNYLEARAYFGPCSPEAIRALRNWSDFTRKT